MAKSKADLLKDAQDAGLVAADAAEDDFTADELKQRLSGDEVFKNPMVDEPIVAPDGHVVLSREDIDARQ